MLHRKEYEYGDDLIAIERTYQNSSLIEETRFIRDGMLVLQEREASNTVTREYTWGLNLGGGIGGLLNLNQGGQNYAYLYDGKGNVEAVLDSTQAVVAGYRYDPFGVLLTTTGSFKQPYGFSTKRYDEQIGMIQYEYRSYLPEVGRWSTRDPLGEAGGMNLYAFVGNNPVNWVDPWGLITEVIVSDSSWHGHVALRINNQVYSNGRYNRNATSSFGMKGNDIMYVQNYNGYISYYRNKGKNSRGYVLKLSPEEEAKVQAFYKDLIKNSRDRWNSGYVLADDYFFLTNNCATTVVNALNEGLSWFDNLWIEAFSPYQLEFHLLTAPWLVEEQVDYPGKGAKK